MLSPNKHSHWTNKYKYKTEYKAACKAIALSHILYIKQSTTSSVVMQDFFCKRGIDLSLDFFPPNNKKFDIDNMIARMKSGIDGCFDAFCVDDFFIRRILATMRETSDPGYVLFKVDLQSI